MKCLIFSAFNSKMLQNYFIVEAYMAYKYPSIICLKCVYSAHNILSSLQNEIFFHSDIICFQSQTGLIYRVSRSSTFRVASPRMGLKKSSSIASASMSRRDVIS